MRLIDTHCHLYFEPMKSGFASVITRARAAGVEIILVPAYDLASWSDCMALEEHEGVFTAFGLHPWVSAETPQWGELRRLLRLPKAVAVGEIGLDYKIENADRVRQMELLKMQIEIALECDLPVMLHCRGAFEELFRLLEGYAPDLRGVLHAFSRGPDLAREAVKLGLYLAFGGAITRPKAERARRSAVFVPDDRMLLETDAPSIGLEGIPPESVEPAHTTKIASELASLRGQSLERIAELTYANTLRLFRILNTA